MDSRMKAVVCERYGPPELLKIREIERPAPKSDEVLVRIHATTVNRTDCGMLRASPFFFRFMSGFWGPRNPVIGSTFAGRIESVGDKVVSFKAGDRVFGFNEDCFGGHAQYMVKRERGALATIPDGISYEQAAASTEGAHYAYNLIKSIRLEEGQKVLVCGATGAIGSAAVQLLKYFGAEITAVCATEHIDLVRGLGANELIDYTREDFTKRGGGYSYIFDTVGKASYIRCRKLLLPGGRFLACDLGPLAQNVLFLLLKPFISDRKLDIPIPKDARGDVLFIRKLMEEGSFTAVIDRKYPLEEIIAAYNYVETGRKTGNVVIEVG